MKYPYIILFFLFFIPIVLPYFGTIDIIAPQWLYLGWFNFFVFIFFFKSKISVIKSSIFYIFLLFILQVLLSLFYTKNLNVSIVDSSRFLIILFSIYNIYNILLKGNFSFKSLSFIISFFLIVELIYSFLPLFTFFLNNDISVYNQFSTVYKDSFFIGFSGNKNITAASIAIKFPFLFYLLYDTKNKFTFTIISFFSFLICCLLLLLKSRSVFVSFSFVLFIFIVFSIYLNKLRFLWILPILSLSYIFVSLLITQNSNPVLNDIKSINFSAASSSDRFLLWDNAFSYILDHPIIGCGIGNWKIESLPYWSTHLSDYIVPYHAHNDFLEITTELGIFGGLTYFIFFVLIFISLASLLFFYKSCPEKFFQVTVLFTSFSVYIIDALLNFPFERPRMQIVLVVLVSLTILFYKRKKIS